MDLSSYILRRILFGGVVLLLVITITFILTHSLGGQLIVAWLGKQAYAHPELAHQYVVRYHLDDPIWVQYYYYIIGILQGNLGYSPSRSFTPVVTVIGQTLPFTLQIVSLAFVITMALGIALGVLAARYRHTAIDEGIRIFYLAACSSPTFFLSILVVIVFSFYFRILPTSGGFDVNLTPPTWITGLPIVDSLLEGNWAYFVSGIEHAILPSIALALVGFGVVTRLLRSSLFEVMRMNYIRTARAKGLSEATVFYKHALRNALLPVVTLSSLMFTWFMTGTIFVEGVFAYPGLGEYVVQCLQSQDYPGIVAASIIFALTIVIGNLVSDILYAVVDPQIRLGG